MIPFRFTALCVLLVAMPAQAGLSDPFGLIGSGDVPREDLVLIGRERLSISSLELPDEGSPAAIRERLLADFIAKGWLHRVPASVSRLRANGYSDPDLDALDLLARVASDAVNISPEAVALEAGPLLDHPYAQLALAVAHRRGGDVDKAQQLAARIIGARPDLAYAHNVIGTVFYERGDLKNAADAFARATELAPAFFAAQANLGSVLLLQGDQAGAARAFSAAIAVEPRHCGALIGRASLAETGGLYGQAADDLQACLASGMDDPAVRRRAVVALADAGRVDEAREVLAPLAGSDPDWANNMAVELALRAGDIDVAADALENIAASPRRQLVRAIVATARGDARAAAAELQAEAIALQAEPAAVLIARAAAVAGHKTDVAQGSLPATLNAVAAVMQAFDDLARGDRKRAAQRLIDGAGGVFSGFELTGLSADQVAAALDPASARDAASGFALLVRSLPRLAVPRFKAANAGGDDFLVHYLNAVAHEQIGDRGAAEAQLRRSLAKLPDFVTAHSLLAEQYLQQGKLEAALQHYEAMAKRAPAFATLLRVGVVRDALGDLAGAEQAYREAVKLGPDVFVGYNQLAWHLAKQNIKLDEAIKLASKADQLQPGNVSVLDTLGWLRYLKGDLKGAQQLLQRANEIAAQGNGDVLYHLAVVSQKLGNNDAARRALDLASGLTTHYESRAAVEALRAGR